MATCSCYVKGLPAIIAMLSKSQSDLQMSS